VVQTPSSTVRTYGKVFSCHWNSTLSAGASNQIYAWFGESKLYVNRPYQRKLAWTLEEKQRPVESILRRSPVSAILLAELDTGDYEIMAAQTQIGLRRGGWPVEADQRVKVDDTAALVFRDLRELHPRPGPGLLVLSLRGGRRGGGRGDDAG